MQSYYIIAIDLYFFVIPTGVGLTDSPAGLAAYILEKFSSWTNLKNKHLLDGGLSKYNINALLDNVMIYWVTGSITTSMRLYSEYASKHYQTLPHKKYVTGTLVSLYMICIVVYT
jgi:hypothetical protein